MYTQFCAVKQWVDIFIGFCSFFFYLHKTLQVRYSTKEAAIELGKKKLRLRSRCRSTVAAVQFLRSRPTRNCVRNGARGSSNSSRIRQGQASPLQKLTSKHGFKSFDSVAHITHFPAAFRSHSPDSSQFRPPLALQLTYLQRILYCSLIQGQMYQRKDDL